MEMLATVKKRTSARISKFREQYVKTARQASVGGGTGSGEDDSSRVPPSPYLTPAEAAVYLRYASAHALRQATKQYGIPHIRRGGRLFYLREQLDEFMAVATEATAPVLGRRRRR
jgi:hypothetical protein